MKKILFIAVLLMTGGLLFGVVTETNTPTVTMTVTETVTETISPTFTETMVVTDTMTPTITQTVTDSPTSTATFTITPTPQGKAFAFPNPAKNTTWVGFAYPMDHNSNDKPVQMVTIIVKAIDGAEAGRAYDQTPNGYTRVDITKYARGIYFYQIIVRFTDGTEKKYPLETKFGKFAVIK